MRQYRNDEVLRAAARLLTERALIRSRMPETAPWWAATVEGYLGAADAAGDLQDLRSLVRTEAEPVTQAAGIRAVAEQIVATWAALPAVAAETGRGDLEDRVYTMWALLLPRLCAHAELARELLTLVRDPEAALQVLGDAPAAAR